MQVSVEVLPGLERKLRVLLPAARIDGEVNKRLEDLKRRVKIHGFRPGKIPLKVVRRRYGQQVRAEVLGELTERSLAEAIDKEGLRPAGGPKIDAEKIAEGDDFVYSATFEIYPEFEVQGVEAVTVERPVAQVMDVDLDAMLEKLRKQRQQWNPEDRPAREDDRVTVDFLGRVDGEAFEGGRAEDAQIVIGSHVAVPGFEEQLIGLRSGETREFTLTLPDNYPREELAGREAAFTVTVKEVAAPELPAIDDKFAEALGVPGGGPEALRSELATNMRRELEQASRARVKQQVMDGLLASNPIEVPQALVEQDIRTLAAQLGWKPEDKGAQAELPQQLRERLEPQARRRMALSLIISRLIAANQMTPAEDRLKAYVESIAASYEDPQGFAEMYMRNREAMDAARGVVLEDQVVDWVLERASVKDTESTFDAVMNPPRK